MALFKAGLISEWNHGNIKKIGWSYGSRTDKGVHAACNIIKCKLELKKSYLKNYDAL